MTTRSVSVILAIGLLAMGCAPTAATPTPSAALSTPAATFGAPTDPPRPTQSATPTGKTAAFPDLTFIAGTVSGDLFFQIKDGQPTGRKVHVCSGAVRQLIAFGRRAAFFCGGSGPADPGTLYVYDDATGILTEIAKTEIEKVAFTTTNGLVYLVMGATVPSAPISMMKLLLRDLRTGVTTQIEEGFIPAFDLWLSGEGVAAWRPANSLSFARPETEAGTWILRGTTLVRFSRHKLIDGGPGHELLESEGRDAYGFSSDLSASSYVLLRTDQETRLTPADVPNEKAVTLLPDGRIFTWRPEGPPDGTITVYKDGAVVRQDRGTFGTYHLLHSADWVIATEISAGTTFRAYRYSDGAFASIPAGNITSLGILGPN